MPVLHALGDVDDIACLECNGRLPPFLVPSLARHADEYLARTVVDVPVVAAPGLEGHVAHGQGRLLVPCQVLGCERSQVAVPREVFGIGRVGFADGEGQAGETVLSLLRGILGPYLLGLVEGRPGLGPSCIEGHVCDDLRYLGACDAVLPGLLEVVGERAVRDALADE